MAKKPGAGAPYLPPAYDLADATALHALSKGEADAEQQIRAWRWITERLCEVYGLSFRPGIDGPRLTDFAEGKRFVGTELKKFENNIVAIRKHFTPGKEYENG